MGEEIVKRQLTTFDLLGDLGDVVGIGDGAVFVVLGGDEESDLFSYFIISK